MFFFILFFSGKGPFCRKFDSWKMNTQKAYWWIVLSYIVSPRKMGRSAHRLILAFFWQPIQLLSVSDVALYVPNHYVFGQHHGGFYTYSGRRIDT